MSLLYTIIARPQKVSPIVYIVVTLVKIDIMENENAKFHSTLYTTIQTHSSISKHIGNLIKNRTMGFAY